MAGPQNRTDKIGVIATESNNVARSVAAGAALIASLFNFHHSDAQIVRHLNGFAKRMHQAMQGLWRIRLATEGGACFSANCANN